MKFGVVGLLSVALLGLGGLAGCETLSQTPGENANMMAHTCDTNGKMIPSEVETLLMLDRPTWLSREPIPNN